MLSLTPFELSRGEPEGEDGLSGSAAYGDIEHVEERLLRFLTGMDTGGCKSGPAAPQPNEERSATRQPATHARKEDGGGGTGRQGLEEEDGGGGTGRKGPEEASGDAAHHEERGRGGLSPRPPGVADIPVTRLSLPCGRRRLRRLPPGCTTLVVRNVPHAATNRDLLESWVPNGSFDFLFFPYNMKRKRRLGYVFLNFTSPGAALGFQAKWHGFDLPRLQSSKKLDIAPAVLQGLQANLDVFRAKRIELMCDPDHLPVILDGTRRVDTRQYLLDHGIVKP